MSRSLEIFICKNLPNKWHEILIESLRSRHNRSFELNQLSETYYIVSLPEDKCYIHISISSKDRFVFSDESYFESIKNIESIEFDSFYHKFSKIDFTILLESKPPYSINSTSNLFSTAKILSEMGEGVIVFDQPIDNYLVDHIYKSSDI